MEPPGWSRLGGRALDWKQLRDSAQCDRGFGIQMQDTDVKWFIRVVLQFRRIAIKTTFKGCRSKLANGVDGVVTVLVHYVGGCNQENVFRNAQENA